MITEDFLPMIRAIDTTAGLILVPTATPGIWAIQKRDMAGYWYVGSKDTFQKESITRLVHPSRTYSLDDAFKACQDRIDWYENPLSPEDTKMLCKQAVSANRHKIDRESALVVVDLIEESKWAEAYAEWKSCDTYVRDGFPQRLCAELLKHAPKADQ